MPRSGPCSPWVSGEDVANLPSIQAQIATTAETDAPLTSTQIAMACATAAGAATEILYDLSGRQFSGTCGPVTIRPVARPTDIDSRRWLGGIGAFGYAFGWSGTGPFAVGIGGPVSAFGDSLPPEIELGGFPVQQVTLVKIDGVVIPSTEYELRDYKTLVRLRPTASSTPTERYGWPTSQINDLPDTEVGTFSITYTYGQDPGDAGRLACLKLAEYLALPQFGDSTHYPQRLTSFTRQGISAAVVDVIDILNKGMLGIYEVDAFLLAVNPNRARKPSMVWSPDIAKRRRTQHPSTS